jgi:hypothetical protein
MNTQIAPQQKLTARWIEVQGELICKWELIDAEKPQGIVLNFPIAAQAA